MELEIGSQLPSRDPGDQALCDSSQELERCRTKEVQISLLRDAAALIISYAQSIE